ncbi:unnamed protein product [Blumeria hordei]|uniref:Uncharacterized protein n=1 Tax=Blumeria hordei TaxID=2867405 RepID=A0A383V0H9_BLUHO|nr:unnamed protein product [Blumeria hordei]
MPTVARLASIGISRPCPTSESCKTTFCARVSLEGSVKRTSKRYHQSHVLINIKPRITMDAIGRER